MSDFAYRLDWQAEPEGFAKYILPTLLVPLQGDARRLDRAMRPGFEDLSKKTDHFKAVELRIYVNDVEVGAKALLDSLERAYHHGIAETARELVSSVGLEQLQDVINDAQRAAIKVLHERLAAAGITLPEREED